MVSALVLLANFVLAVASQAPPPADCSGASCGRVGDANAFHALLEDEDEDEAAMLQTTASKRPTLQKTQNKDGKVDFVLDLGAPRTGTQTMYEALNRLGFNPMHSGMHWQIRPTLCNYVFGNGSFAPNLPFLDGYDGGMDEPFQFIYEEVMERWPNSKFVLTLRDSEDWWQSYYKFMRCAGRGETTDSRDPKDFENIGAQARCEAAAYWGCDWQSDNKTKEQCKSGMEAHYALVQRVIPADRLLLYNFSDGYEPLAEFLEVDVPRYPNGTIEPLPHRDEIEINRCGEDLHTAS